MLFHDVLYHQKDRLSIYPEYLAWVSIQKIVLIELYNEKYELDQVIKENTNDEKLNMIPIIDEYFNSPIYEITVR